MASRRRVLASASGFLMTQQVRAQFGIFGLGNPKPAPAQVPLVLFGTDTDKGVSKGIYAAHFDPATGHLSEPTLAAATVRPAYFAVGPARGGKKVLYVGNEGLTPALATVTSWAIDAGIGILRPLGSVSSGGIGPCYVSVDVTGQAVYVADYMGSAVSSYKVLPNGALSAPVQVLNFNEHKRFGGLGPQKDRQDAAHPHAATISPDNRFVVVCDLGTDRISIFPVQPEQGRLGVASSFDVKAGSGPRHVAFHPNGRWVYGICELANRIDQYLWTSTHGRNASALLVDTGNWVTTLAADYAKSHAGVTNTAAEIAVSDDGRFLYASNRGEDTLVVYTLDAETGAPQYMQRIGCGGKGPRHFTLDPTGRWLVCGNQSSATVTVFARDAASGRLSGPVQTVALDSVMFTLFV